MSLWSRRSLLQFAGAMVPLQFAGASRLFAATQSPAAAGPSPSVTDSFPGHPPELVREVVTVAHFNEKRVRELVDARPSLARAANDWGFGDWETALGAASHMGNRGIAEYLIGKGARPSLFSAAMLGQLDVVKAFVAAQPGAHRIAGPHGISLLAHARVGGAAARPVLEFLQGLGDPEEQLAALSPEDASLLSGTYVFGSGDAQQVQVDANMKMYGKAYTHPPQLNWTRKGTMTRPLFHIGDHTFYPAGAPAARIRFTREESDVVMTVSDPGVVLTARKKAS